jgi:hypothetical protein
MMGKKSRYELILLAGHELSFMVKAVMLSTHYLKVRLFWFHITGERYKCYFVIMSILG